MTNTRFDQLRVFFPGIYSILFQTEKTSDLRPLLYYYKGCNEDKNNWKMKQVTSVGEFEINMRMWNPNYEFVKVAYKKSESEAGNTKAIGSRLLVREPINPLLAQKGNVFVGSHWIVQPRKTFVEGFYLPAVFKQASSPSFSVAASKVTPCNL